MPETEKKDVQEQKLPENLYGVIGLVVKAVAEKSPWILVLAGIVFAIFMFLEQQREFKDQQNKQQNKLNLQQIEFNKQQHEQQIKFNEQQNKLNTAYDKAKTDADEKYEKKLSVANDQIIEGFTQVATMSTNQMASVRELLELQEKVADVLKKQQNETRLAKEAADKEVKRAEEAKFEAEQLKKEADSVINKKEALIKELDEKELTLKTKEKEIAEKSKTLTKRVKEIDNLTSQHINLAKEFLTLTEHPSAPESYRQTKGYEIAGNVRKTYFPEDQTNPIRTWLIEYASNPGQEALDMLQKLVGTSQKELEPILMTDLGFVHWIKYTITSIDDDSVKDIVYFGAVDQVEFGYKNYLLIILSLIDNGDSKELKVDDVNGDAIQTLVVVPDPDDWNNNLTYLAIRYYGFDELDDEVGSIDLLRNFKPGKWSDKNVMESYIDRETERLSTHYLFGRTREFESMNYLQLKERFPLIYDAAILNEYEQFKDAVEMSERARTYDVQSLVKTMEFGKLPPRFLNAFSSLLNSSIKKDIKTASRLLERTLDKRVIGQIASAALKEAFEITQVEPVYQEVPPSQPQDQAQQMAPTVPEQPVRNIVGYDIYARYLRSSFESEEEAVQFGFRQASTEYGWVLHEFKKLTSMGN